RRGHVGQAHRLRRRRRRRRRCRRGHRGSAAHDHRHNCEQRTSTSTRHGATVYNEPWMSKSDYEWTLSELERKVGELRHDLRKLERKMADAAAENEVLTATVRALLGMLTEAAVLEPQAISRR